MYPFPISLEETDFAEKKDQQLILKTYGLPYIFWIYAILSVAVIFFMFLAIKDPVLKLVELGDETDATLGYSLLAFIGATPLIIFSFFFYEKRLIAGKNLLRIEHRLFGMKYMAETILFDDQDELKVEPFLASPNVARMKGGEEAAGFQNKGYFVLWLENKAGKKVQIDRHSRKADLEKLKGLLVGVIKP
jgi:hypothetical protein